jgi:hypothetical protein
MGYVLRYKMDAGERSRTVGIGLQNPHHGFESRRRLQFCHIRRRPDRAVFLSHPCLPPAALIQSADACISQSIDSGPRPF